MRAYENNATTCHYEPIGSYILMLLIYQLIQRMFINMSVIYQYVQIIRSSMRFVEYTNLKFKYEFVPYVAPTILFSKRKIHSRLNSFNLGENYYSQHDSVYSK